LAHPVYVAQLKCQHAGYAIVLTFQFPDIYICMSHESIMDICFVASLTKIWSNSIKNVHFFWHGTKR